LMFWRMPGEAKRKGLVVEELVVQVLIEVAVAVVALLFGQLLKKIGLVSA
jgi:hypothetical protein